MWLYVSFCNSQYQQCLTCLRLCCIQAVCRETRWHKLPQLINWLMYVYVYRPGHYESRLPTTRKVTYHQSFGGRPINLPDVTQHSTIDANTDKVCNGVYLVTYWYVPRVSLSWRRYNTQLYSHPVVVLATDVQILQDFLYKNYPNTW